MEGSWGRRIFGTVKKGDQVTEFHLEMRTRDGQFITSTFRASNEDLEQWPGEYGLILNKMVESIDQMIHNPPGDHL